MSMQSLTFIGNSSFLIKGTYDGTSYVLGIDPWLTENPSCPAEYKSLAQLDVIALTHGHFDHAGDAAELAIKHKAQVVGAYELVDLLVADGVPSEQAHYAAKGGSVHLFGLTITLTNAFHSSSYKTKTGTAYAGEACGIVVSDGTTTIYHAGDTCLFGDMVLIGEMYQPNISLLPIDGRFNMDPRAAARAAKMLGSETYIPMHFGTYPLLVGEPKDFVAWCEREGVEGKVRVLESGEEMAIS
jgi:L-ascorbate metabolism protein UlaG (beta-lactamase superfamily)